MKELSQYTVNIHESYFRSLEKCGLVEEPVKGIYIVADHAQYDRRTGLSLGNHWMEEILIK